MLTSPFTLTNLLTGLFFVIFGFFYYNYPPKNINTISGYRTSASMRSQQTWDAANRYSSRIMFIVGIILFILGILSIFITFFQNLHVLVGVGVTILAAFSIFLFTEEYLDKEFDEDGSPRKA
jgi:uncharacterized membrane protein